MWVDVTLKCPDEGEWFALTRVTSGGETALIAYLTREDVAKVNDGSANFELVGVSPQPPSFDAAIAALDASGDLYLEQAADWLRQSQGAQK